MKMFIFVGVALALACHASAAPNVANSAQKGSLLIFPDIDVRGTTETLVRISNDGAVGVEVKCVWMDGNRNRTDFVVTVTRNQPTYFDARTGRGPVKVNAFPFFAANGYDNPYLGGANRDPYFAGLLICFAVDIGELNQVKWNHLSGSATVYDPVQQTAYEYPAYAFFVQNGIDLDPIGSPGILYLNGVDYDSCPLYQIGQMSPEGSVLDFGNGDFATYVRNRLAVVGCNLPLNQDWTPVTTKLQFDIWNADEVKFSGAFDCADSWHETTFTDIDSSGANFTRINLGSDSARYRVQGVKSTQCAGSQAVGIVAVQSALVTLPGRSARFGSSMAAAGKFQGRVIWDPQSAVPEWATR